MKSILITGTNRGIGLGLVKALIKEHFPKYIIATCRKPENAVELQSLAARHKNIHILQLDLREFNTYKNVANEVWKIVESDGVNVLINNAGISHKFTRIGYLKYESMLDAFTVNCVAPTIMCKEFLPLLKQAAQNHHFLPVGSERAAVVNITSSLGSIAANEDGGFYSYRCSKTALNAATKSLSVDLLAHNIIATCIHPGWVKTKMGGPNAPLEIDEACGQLMDTIKKLNLDHNGGFYSYDGSELLW